MGGGGPAGLSPRPPAGPRRNLEVDFFGGEPLMNWDVVKRLVEYARSVEKERGNV